MTIQSQPAASSAELAEFVWETRYRRHSPGASEESSLNDTWLRVAQCVAQAEAASPDRFADVFHRAMADLRFLPGGRVLANAGAGPQRTLFNCFVMGELHDNPDAIAEALHEGALTLQYGGGIGYDFSPLRPAGQRVGDGAATAPGPVRLIEPFDSLCAGTSTGTLRPGAMMATLACDHQDIRAFIDAKREPGRFSASNLSVLVSDAFMDAVREDAPWPPTGQAGTPPARALWDALLHAAYETGEPGVLFIDRINETDNLGYVENIHATNPCGEIPLPAYGACDLGSINLTRFVRRPFANDAEWDIDGLVATTTLAVRFLDDVIDVSPFPLEQQAAQARGSRRIGLGVTGLADSLILLGRRYGSRQGRMAAAVALRTVCHAAYRASCALAAEKGSFPWFDRDALLARPFIQSLPDNIRARIHADGLRNSHLIALAPAGSISLLADCVSSGIEPLPQIETEYRIGTGSGTTRAFNVTAYARRAWERHGGGPLPASFVTATALEPDAHLLMQAELQRYVDNAISKTINLSPETPFDVFRVIYDEAYRLGLKGCTVFRPNPSTGEGVVGTRCGVASNAPIAAADGCD
ncbi:MAG: adenosylcobalamin-dependent ribonucleoside-diphosphate reductase [Gammaproteobacteria bacterium]|nr:adenosylcobalamin-dependent ribonucleoside-diphosphate reductase [Gammaproteobacteria bacterium]